MIFLFLGTGSLSMVLSQDLETQDFASLLDESKKLLRKNSDESLKLAEQAKLLISNRESAQYLEAILLISSNYQNISKYNKADSLLNEAETIAETQEFEELLAKIYHAQGLTYQFKGNNELAFDKYKKALEINERIKNQFEIFRQLNNIGLILREEKQYDKALDYFVRCETLIGELGNEEYAGYVKVNLGYILMELDDWVGAKEKFLEYINNKKIHVDSFHYATGLYLLADSEFNLKNLDAAKNYAEASLSRSKSIDFAMGQIYASRVLCNIYTEEQNYRRAEKNCNQAIELVNKHSSKIYYEDVLESQLILKKAQKNYQGALAIQETLFQRLDSINKIKFEQKIANSTLQYEIDRQDQETELLKLKNTQGQRISFFLH